MGNDKSKLINITIENKKISIPDFYTLTALKEYFSSYEQDKDYRRSFCNLIFTMITTKNEEKINDIKINDVELLSNKFLIKIMKIYLKHNNELNKFEENFDNDWFKTFYLVRKMEFRVIFENISNSIPKMDFPVFKLKFSLAYKQFNKNTNAIFKAFKRFQENFDLILEPIKKAVVQFNDLYGEQFIDILKRLKEFNEEFQQFKQIIISLGFPPHLELMPYEVADIVNTFNNYGREKATEKTYAIYINHFDNENIKEMFDRWYQIDVLNERRDIIKQAVNAHLHGNYYLSIPIVFSQIEGLIANIFHHKGQMKGNKYLEYIDLLLNSKKDYSFDSLISEFYSKIVMVTFHHNEPIGSVLSRHAIMHGGDTKYGTKINSIKALLLFDYMINKMNDYVNKNKLLVKNS